MSRTEIPGQMSFDFGSPLDPPKPRPAWRRKGSNFFFAIMPEPEPADEISRLAEELRSTYDLTGRQRRKELLHITLNGVGNWIEPPPAVVAAAIEAGQQVRAAQFRVGLDCCLSFRGGARNPFVLLPEKSSPDIITLRREIDEAMASVGLKRGGALGATPHMTTLYDREIVPRTALDPPILWLARYFVLVESFQGDSQYVIRGRWPLHNLS
jgi:2'-5' RNA ligase